MKKILTLSLAALMAFSAPANVVLAAPDTKVEALSVNVKAAKATAISTVEDLKAMESNPSGNYYLAKDIKLSADFHLFGDREHPFKGQLDGKGHKLTGYTYKSSTWAENVGIFGYANGAVFKNISVTGVDIDLQAGGRSGTLVCEATSCTFDQIKTAGKISVKGEAAYIGGIVYSNDKNAVTKNCVNDIDITVNVKGTDEGAPACDVGEIAALASGSTSKSVLQNCTNKGTIKVNYKPSDGWGGDGFSVAGVATSFFGKKAVKNCKNTGAVTCTIDKAAEGYATQAKITGVIGESNGGIDTCSNTGKITVNCNVSNATGINVAGVVGETTYIGTKMVKSFNTGAITVTANAPRSTVVGGVAGVANDITQSYNKGKVTVNVKSGGDAAVGGLAGQATANVQNCYNTGAVSLSAKKLSYVGGLVGSASVFDQFIKYNYSTGKVTGSSKQVFKGNVLGYYTGSYDAQKRNVYDNYYTGSGKAYGGQDFTWKPYMGTAKKVSAITAGNCSKLASKLWTYSSKQKRMILKNNKEK